MKEVETQIIDLLHQRHRIQPNQENDFSVRNLTELMSSAEQSANVMSLLLGAIASISLIVGGIGIMNIMLVSVTERTREIGIRIAVGAKGRDILLQFLIESLVLSLMGGMLGIGIGMVGTLTLSHFTQWPTLSSLSKRSFWPFFSPALWEYFSDFIRRGRLPSSIRSTPCVMNSTAQSAPHSSLSPLPACPALGRTGADGGRGEG